MPDSNTFSAISEKLADRIKNGDIEVPMLPEVAGKVLRLTQDPDSGAPELSTLIQSDQTLAGHVMKVANSALYSPNSSMVSLQQATARLGMKLIAEIALSASVNSTLFNTPGFEKHIEYEIKYSLASGLWAKEVARACRKNVEAAFLGGLLHDIGRPVAVQSALESASAMKIALSTEEVMALEDKHQRDISIKVVEKWEMPQSVCDVVAYFDKYDSPHSVQNQTMTVVAGSLLASHFMCEEVEGKQCMTKDEVIQHPVFADLNLYQDEIDGVLEREEAVNSALGAMVG